MTLATTRGLGGSLRLAAQPELPVTVLVRHQAEDPALIQVAVVLSDEESFDLPLDRTLLTAGVTSPAVDGDVAVSVELDRVLVQVGELGLLLGLQDVIDVLLASYAAAPTGAEQDVVISLTAARELLRT